MKTVIAAYQMKIIPFNLTKNLGKIEGAAKKASRKKSNFLVLPENCWSGILYQEKYKNEVAEFVKEHTSKLSKRYGLYIIAGSCHEIKEELGSEPHNISYLFTPQGKIAGYYAKRHLYKGETHDGLMPGKSHKVFDTEFGKIGIQICRDVLYPEATKVMGDMGAQIVFSPAFWSKFSSEYNPSINRKYHVNDEVQTIKYLVPARAIENELIFVFANAAGSYNTDHSRDILLGYTQICQPFNGPVEIYRHNHEKLMIQVVDTEVVDTMRTTWQIRGN